jgi:hypothetical protein
MMLTIRPWRRRVGVWRETKKPVARGNARMPRTRVSMLWRRPRRFTQGPSAPSSGRIALDIHHRLDLLLRWTSSMTSFNEQWRRTMQERVLRWPVRGSNSTERPPRQAAARLFAGQGASRAEPVLRRGSTSFREGGRKDAASASVRFTARTLRYFTGTTAQPWPPRLLPSGKHRGDAAGIAMPDRTGSTASQGRRPRARLFAHADDAPAPGGATFARAARRFALSVAPTPASEFKERSRPARPARTVRQVELAWRRNPAGSPTSPEDTASLSPALTAAVRNLATAEVNSKIDMRRPPTPHQAVQPSDARAVNRLADEVLGRIERKLRIERERRGR